jgi:hypothetical protein
MVNNLIDDYNDFAEKSGYEKLVLNEEVVEKTDKINKEKVSELRFFFLIFQLLMIH